MARVNSGNLGRVLFVISVLCWVPIGIAFFSVLSFKNEHVRVETITRETIASNVYNATVEYLSSYFKGSQSQEKLDVSYPEVVFVESLATWREPRGFRCCRIDGVDYTVGDYCQYGLVLDVLEARVYCSLSNKVTIIRQRVRAPDAAASLGEASRGRANFGDDGLL